MRARAAVIPTLSTTGILLAASLLMLAVVSALVAFRGWPGGTGDSVASVPVGAGAHTPVALAQVRSVALPKAGLERVARSAPAAPRPVSAGGLVKVEQVRTAPTGIVKVPAGVHMTLPPVATPTVRTAPTTPATEPPPVTPEEPSQFLPPPGPTPDDVQETVGDVVGPLPQLGDPGTATAPVTVTQGEGGGAISVGILGTAVNLPLP
jgi:hypothetical protein